MIALYHMAGRNPRNLQLFMTYCKDYAQNYVLNVFNTYKNHYPINYPPVINDIDHSPNIPSIPQFAIKSSVAFSFSANETAEAENEINYEESNWKYFN